MNDRSRPDDPSATRPTQWTPEMVEDFSMRAAWAMLDQDVRDNYTKMVRAMLTVLGPLLDVQRIADQLRESP